MSSISPLRATAYHHASDLPAEFWAALKQKEVAANIILPFATKALGFPPEDRRDQLWIILYDDTRKVEFVLSCTKGLLGDYPIFIYTPKSPAQLAREEFHLVDSLLQLVLCLLNEVPPQRVFSVFAIAKVAEKFAEIFEERTCQEHGIRAIGDLYYDATLTLCTNATLNKSSTTFPSLPEPGDFLIALRPGDMSDLEGIKALCKEFSYTSPPYLLGDERAELEAGALITSQQVWVHMIKEGDEAWEIACIVATSRESENVTAVTKVFTSEKWRGRRCAARLLHRVCHELVQRDKTVALYVGNTAELAPARRLYHKIGFQGLNAQQDQEVENVDGLRLASRRHLWVIGERRFSLACKLG